MEGYKLGGGRGRMGEKVQGLRNIIGRYKIRQGDVKNSIGNGEAKEFIHTTHEHEIRQKLLEGRGVPGREVQRGKIGITIIA